MHSATSRSALACRADSPGVLEMEGAQEHGHPWPAVNDLFDLDMDGDEIAWRRCPGAVALAATRQAQSRVA